VLLCVRIRHAHLPDGARAARDALVAGQGGHNRHAEAQLVQARGGGQPHSAGPNHHSQPSVSGPGGFDCNSQKKKQSIHKKNGQIREVVRTFHNGQGRKVVQGPKVATGPSFSFGKIYFFGFAPVTGHKGQYAFAYINQKKQIRVSLAFLFS
jgi:hypothetical protein